MQPSEEDGTIANQSYDISKTLWVVLLVAVTVGLSRAAIMAFPWVSGIATAVPGALTQLHPLSGIVLPNGILPEIGFALWAAGNGWLGSRIVLRHSFLSREIACTVGLALAFWACCLGIPAMWAVVVGQETVGFIALGEGVLSFALAVATIMQCRKPPQAAALKWPSVSLDPERQKAAPVLGTLAIVLSIFVVGASVLYVLKNPVVEWDALIYHVATSRLWYLGRPNPPLHFGPSVGIEISGNFPPLFPAIGLATSLIGGSFQTFWLRILSPLMLLAVLLMVFGYCRARLSTNTGLWAVILLAGCPILVVYAMWSTNYVMLTALTAATVLAADVACERGTGGAWCTLGLVAGLAMMTNYIGLLSVIVCLLACCFLNPRGLRPVALMSMAAGVLLVGCAWWLRDWIAVGDPVYPLLTSVWHGRALNNKLFTATLTDLRTSALSGWRMSSLPLTLSEGTTALMGRVGIVVGSLAGLLYSLFSPGRNRAVLRWLAITNLAFVVILLAPGWYWTRYLLPLFPITAIIAGSALSAMSIRIRSARGRMEFFAGIFTIALLDVTAFLSTAIGFGLGLAGPSEFGVITPALPNGVVNFMWSLENPGSRRASLWVNLSGDLLAWEWLNQHSSGGQMVATLDPRTLYLRAPQHVLYLDGRMALPLLHMNSPAEMSAYLHRLGVRWIDIPENVLAPMTYDPVLRDLPLVRFLGTAAFPLRAEFSIHGLPWLTSIYAVGGPERPTAPAIFPGYTSPPPLLNGDYIVARHALGAVIQVAPGQIWKGSKLQFQYCLQHGATLVAKLPSRPGGRPFSLALDAGPQCGSGWGTTSLALPDAASTVVSVRLWARGGGAEIRNAAVL